MVCIYCGSDTNVTNSRLQKRVNQVWRRRQCQRCGSNFTTHEVADLGSTIVVHSTAHDLQPFSRDLLFVSIYESLKHRNSALADATALTQTIIGELVHHATDGQLERDSLVAIAAAVLERFDKTASTMYAAYHLLQK
jgi:transcriptional regulator NrdR family protein